MSEKAAIVSMALGAAAAIVSPFLEKEPIIGRGGMAVLGLACVIGLYSAVSK